MFLWSSLVFLMLDLVTPHVLVGTTEAHHILTRRRRANTFLEEFKQGNLERECVEERCNFEEAREIFEDFQQTHKFWTVYMDGNACSSHPCLNGGHCEDGIGNYLCYCPTGYQGHNCEIGVLRFCEKNNGDCQHFCHFEDDSVRCSCADGYLLSSDGKTCESNEPFKCGVVIPVVAQTMFTYKQGNESNETADIRTQLNETDDAIIARHISETFPSFNSSNTTRKYYNIEDVVLSEGARIVDGTDCLPGQCPWQALIINEKHKGFCGGTILNEYFILTAAHCVAQSKYIYVRLGEFDVLVDHNNEATHKVERINRHNRYNPVTLENDIALIKVSEPIKFTRYILPACLPEMSFAEQVLMRQPDGVVSGFGRLGEGLEQSTILQRLTVPYVDRTDCLESTEKKIYSTMFCAGYKKIAKDSCKGDSGGPHVTLYHGTYFVTGVVSWGEGCAREGKYGIYTQVSKYIDWIRKGMEYLMIK